MEAKQRTQIYLTSRQVRALERRKRQTGLSVAELIRKAIDRMYLGREQMSIGDRIRILRETAGAWQHGAETGEEYVERLRSGRLARLHADR